MIKKIKMKDFLENPVVKSELKNMSYYNLWNFINNNEKKLLKNEIIIVDKSGINNKIEIIDQEELIQLLRNKYSGKKKSIRTFIKHYENLFSYSSVYTYIKKNKRSLTEKEVIKIEKSGKLTSIEILNFDALKDGLEF